MQKKEIQQRVMRIINKLIDDNNITTDVNLDTPLNEGGIGFDSLARLNLLSRIEQDLHIEFPEEYWGDKTFNNINDLINQLYHMKGLSE